MQLTHDRAEGYFFIRAVRPSSVIVMDRELSTSFLIAPDSVVENWPVRVTAEIDADALEAILRMDPEVVILGTGPGQAFPAQSALLPILRQGIGVEVMDNSAAGRTYNLLASERRRVVAAFMLPGSSQAPG